MRVCRLDQEGKLQNIILHSPKTQNKARYKDSGVDAFDLPTTITPVQKNTLKNPYTPHTGDIVYTSDHLPVRLTEEALSNANSITYQTDHSGMQAKIYQSSWLTTSYFNDKVKCMLEKTIQYEGICWPTDLLHDQNGVFVGILVPEAKGYQLKQQLMSQQGLERNFPDWNKYNLVHLVNTILDKIIYLQKRNVLFGIINPSSIFVEDEDHVYFADMDTYQIEGYPILTHEKIMQPPELQNADGHFRLYTHQQDNYEIALLVFMLLMPGKFPYNKGRNKSISESIQKMTFAFNYKQHGEEHGAREYFGLWRFAWSHLGNDLKQAFYYTFQHDQPFSIPEKRKNAKFWKENVKALEEDLKNPYDKESLRMFPQTFKRFKGTETIQCIKCGINHPKFYYKYPEKRICNSCLARPSTTYFTCRTCRKDFYYDLFTLFKYEKLVEEKNFSMPTHCPYCRQDKAECPECKKLVPIFHMNKKGICFDCAKKVVQEYPCAGKCGRTIKLTRGDIDFYSEKQMQLPKYCKICKEKRRRQY